MKKPKRVKVAGDIEALAKAVSSLAPSEEAVKNKMELLVASKAEQEHKVQFLVEQTREERNQEKHDFLTWRQSECEKYLSDGIPFPDETKAKLEAKMSQLAEDFLKDNF